MKRGGDGLELIFPECFGGHTVSRVQTLLLECRVGTKGGWSRQIGGFPFEGRVVELAQLAVQNVGGPAVENDVVRGQEEDMFALAQAKEAGAEKSHRETATKLPFTYTINTDADPEMTSVSYEMRK